MTDDEVRRRIDELERALLADAIDEVEHGLAHDDPVFVQHIGHIRHIHRTEVATAISVFVLLAAAVVLLTVGVATASWTTWLGGILAMLGSFAANALHDRALHRWSGVGG